MLSGFERTSIARAFASAAPVAGLGLPRAPKIKCSAAQLLGEVGPHLFVEPVAHCYVGSKIGWAIEASVLMGDVLGGV